MSGTKHGNGNTSREERRKSRKIKTTRSVETQTEENSFCLCFIPEYKAQLDEEQELDPRIRLMLDQLHVLTEGKVTCVVRNFEKKPKWTAKQRWKMSGNAVRAVGKFKGKKKKLMNVTLTNYEDEELKSGFYTKDVVEQENEEEDDFFTNIIKAKRRFSLKRFSLKKRNPRQRSYSDYGGQRDRLIEQTNGIIEAHNGAGKAIEVPEVPKSQENLIIESFINECMRESMRNHKNNNKNNREKERHRSDRSSAEENRDQDDERDNKSGTYSPATQKERKHVTRSITMPNNGSRYTKDSAADDRRETIPREARRSEGEDRVEESRKKTRRPRSDVVGITDIAERQKRASERMSNYYEKTTNLSQEEHPFSRRNGIKKHSRQENGYDSEHGSTLSAFALVPGTDLQRKLSQHGINDKASIDVITRQTRTNGSQKSKPDRKYPPPSSSARNPKPTHHRRSFQSVDNIYASSSTSSIHQNKRFSSSHMTNNLQNSFSADDIDDTSSHVFKPLKSEIKDGGTLNFMVTSTPREIVEDVPEEREAEEEEGYATYV
ncbi:transcription initiation factor TFIID subunit 1-like isoform X2 [Clytia hemisphaerica]